MEKSTIEIEFQGNHFYKVRLRSPATNICEAIATELNLDLAEVFEYLLLFALTTDVRVLIASTEALVRRKRFYDGHKNN